MSEEKKITLEELEDLLEDGGSSPKKFDFRTIFTAVVLNWYWFLLSLVIFVSGAVIYLRYAEPVYQVSARMFIKDGNHKNKGGQALSSLEDLGFMTNSTGIESEMEILQSRVLLRDAVKDLKLYTEYRREGEIRDVITYVDHPFSVDLDPQHLDSLDFNLLERTQWLDITVNRAKNGYAVSGSAMEGKKEISTFSCHISSLPATFKTGLGTVTMTAVPGRVVTEGDTYHVTIHPPMLVATQYLSRLTIEPTSKVSSIAKLTLKDNDYRRGMDVLRHLTVCYNRQANADKNEVALRTEEFINDRMAKINAELGNTESQIQTFKQKNAVTSLADASQSVQLSNEFSTRLSEANSQVQIIDYMRDFVSNPKNKYQVIPSNVGITDAASTSLINSYNQAVQDRNRLLKAASEEAPQVRTVTATVDELQQSVQAALAQARRSADVQRQGIQSQFSKHLGRITAAPEQERVLNQVGRQQDVKSTLYMLLLQKREENSIALAATADNGKLIDEPLLEGKVSPKTPIVLLAALLLGLALPALVLWLISVFSYKVEGRADVERLTSLPVIADVPMASEKVRQKAGIVVKADRNDQIDEIFRSLRSNILFMLNGDKKVACFTSTDSGEGKSFIAANVAVSFASLGKKVILCGLDIRRPSLGTLFGVPNLQKGITPLLTLNEVTREDLLEQIQTSGVSDGLDLLLAGPVPPNPAELLARDNFADIVAILREQYDYVIFDTAPVGLVTDTLQIARQADITVYTCRADYTPKSSFELLNKLAEEKRLPNPCVVVNGIDMSRRKNGYYYGYGRYGKYGRYSSCGVYGNYGQFAKSHYSNEFDDSIKK